jgi:nicotinamide-nucleotide amidase
MLKRKSNLLVLHETIHAQGLGESFIADKIKDIEDSFPPNLKLAYLPHYSIVRLRLTAKGNDEAALKKTISDFKQKIESRIGEFVFGYNDTSLEKVIGEVLRQQNKTIATAESCTGGLIAQKIVSVAGASDYFKGSIVCYDNETKEKILGVKAETLKAFGAVSEECVKEMVNGLLKVMRADYGIAVSGIAGPSGGTPEKPVGTIWIAVADSTETITRNFSFPGNRDRVMELSAINALGMLLKFAKAKI